MTPDEILKVCVGDTLDAPNRSAFPKTKADLLTLANGAQMFAIARQALLDVAKHNKDFDNVSKKNADKFCHGYGMLQYDLQFFKTDPDFFLQKKWENFDHVIAHGVSELSAAQKRVKLDKKPVLSDDGIDPRRDRLQPRHIRPGQGSEAGFKDSEEYSTASAVDDYYLKARRYLTAMGVLVCARLEGIRKEAKRAHLR